MNIFYCIYIIKTLLLILNIIYVYTVLHGEELKSVHIKPAGEQWTYGEQMVQ